MNFIRYLAATIVALAPAWVVPASSGEIEAGAVTMTCTNQASGANWKIMIDYKRRTVDSNPARISNTEISWRDPKAGGNYTLDRKSGNLTITIASSTGGYFLHHHCTLENRS
jgi:hypothetical protein